jgi:hypothetical protein
MGPPGRDAGDFFTLASVFIGGAGGHLRDRPDVWVTGVTGGWTWEGRGENGLMFRLEHM